jgi:hypothetical protein
MVPGKPRHNHHLTTVDGYGAGVRKAASAAA